MKTIESENGTVTAVFDAPSAKPAVEPAVEPVGASKSKAISTEAQEFDRVMNEAGLRADVVQNLIAAGFDTAEKLKAASDEELDDVEGIGHSTVQKLREVLG